MNYNFSKDLKSVREILGMSQSELADQIGGNDVQRHLSLSIAMVLAAGVRRGTIKSALRVSHELH